MKTRKNNLCFFGNLSSIKIHFLEIILLLILFLSFSSCDVNNNDNDNLPPCPPNDIVATPPYDSPSWHPSGNFIGFNHTPLLKITYPYGEHCQGVYEWDPHQSGFWLINPDGSNMRRIFPYKLLNPVWSPDGEWIAFVMPLGDERHICKMRFTGETFDTTTLVQLTTEGRNFFPDWSSDGRWIAYDNTDCGNAFDPPPPNSCGLLIIQNNGTNRRFLVRGRMPAWSPNGINLAYIGLKNEIYRVNVWDTTEVSRLTSFNQIDPYTRDNRYPHYVFGNNIVFWSDGNLWMMDSSGASQKQLSNQRIDYIFSVSPSEDKVVYTLYEPNNWTYENGTLCILDLTTGGKRQLTLNQKP